MRVIINIFVFCSVYIAFMAPLFAAGEVVGLPSYKQYDAEKAAVEDITQNNVERAILSAIEADSNQENKTGLYTQEFITAAEGMELQNSENSPSDDVNQDIEAIYIDKPLAVDIETVIPPDSDNAGIFISQTDEMEPVQQVEQEKKLIEELEKSTVDYSDDAESFLRNDNDIAEDDKLVKFTYQREAQSLLTAEQERSNKQQLQQLQAIEAIVNQQGGSVSVGTAPPF